MANTDTERFELGRREVLRVRSQQDRRCGGNGGGRMDVIVLVGPWHPGDQVVVVDARDLPVAEGGANLVGDRPSRSFRSGAVANPDLYQLAEDVVGPGDSMEVLLVASQDEVEERHRVADVGVRQHPRELIRHRQ